MPMSPIDMASDKSVPLLGRLALQLEYITPDQLHAASRAQAELPDKRFGDVLVDLGFIDTARLEKLMLAQKQVVAKHRARQVGNLVEKPASASGRQTARAAAGPTAAAIHAHALHGAQVAAPATPELIQEISERGPGARASRAEGASDSPAKPQGPALRDLPVDVPRAKQPTSATAAEILATAATPERPVPEPARPEAPLERTPGEAALELTLPDPGPADRARLEALLADAVAAGASDIHIHSGSTLKLRIHGALVAKDSSVIARDEAERLVAAAISPEERAQLCRTGELDYCFDVAGVGRFRANSYRQQRGMDVVFRSISPEPPTLESLGLPRELAKFANYHQGMLLITGPSGCGKSATLAAMVNLVNQDRAEHILSIEDPIEVLHPSRTCIVNQRHAGHHSRDFARALRGALREDPDIIVIGELRDLETISLAMTAAETGHFVLATLHTNNAVRTIGRMIGAFPSAEQSQVRAMLSESLRAVISQRLVPRADGNGRVPALEMLVVNKAIANLIRDEKTVQIRSAIQTGAAQGMLLLEQSLNRLVVERVITRETALAFAEDKKLITGGA